jgi:hypothetical protein
MSTSGAPPPPPDGNQEGAMTYVVKKTMRDIGSAQYPMLMHTNYAEWSVMMKEML